MGACTVRATRRVPIILSCLPVVAGLVLGNSGNVLAQQGAPSEVVPSKNAPAEEARHRQIEQVVTRARKMAREEVAQDVPIASTVVDAATIEINHYLDIRDVAKMVPSTDFRETSTFPGIQRF